jgi:hypothetical protein
MSETNVALLYETHARSGDPKDFQSQVIRTPHGKSVGQTKWNAAPGLTSAAQLRRQRTRLPR